MIELTRVSAESLWRDAGQASGAENAAIAQFVRSPTIGEITAFLTPDAQGHVSTEEVCFATVAAHLQLRSPELTKQFLREMDRLIEADNGVGEGTELIQSALNNLAGRGILTADQAQKLFITSSAPGGILQKE